MSKITDERLDEMLAGLEGLPGGPWGVYDGCSWRRVGTVEGRYDDCAVLYPVVASDGHPDLSSRGGDRDDILAHIARCDPDTMRSILTELRALRSKSEAVGVKALDEALHHQIDEYWRIAWREGSAGRVHDNEDNDASRVRAEIDRLISALTHPAPATGVSDASPWQEMDSAPLDGKHCILAVKEGAFVYSVQGAYQAGQWNCVHRDNVKPLYWMPNKRLPEGWEAKHPALVAALTEEGA